MFKASLWRLGAAVALTAVALVGCGDDDDGDGTPGTGGEAGSGTGGNATGGNNSGGEGGDGGLGGMGGATQQDILDTVEAQGDFTTLVLLIQRVNLEDTFRDNGPLTLFAPTDEAFEAFETDNPGVLEGMTDDEVSNLLRYHLVDGRLLESDLVNDEQLETLADDNPTITVNVNNGDVTLTDGSDLTDDATITEADIGATNGVIHAIDGLLLPPEE